MIPNSQVIGQETEQAVDSAVRGYDLDGLCHIEPTYPRFAKIRGVWTPVGTGLPDRVGTVDLPEFDLVGTAILFDIKSVKQDNTVLLKRAHQYWMMIDFASRGAITGYLVRWYGEGFQEWRWHWTALLPETEWSMRSGGKGKGRQPVELVRLERAGGLVLPTMVESLIPEVCSTPDFLRGACGNFVKIRDELKRLAREKRR